MTDLDLMMIENIDEYEKALNENIANTRAAQTKNYSTIEIIDPQNKTVFCGYKVQLKFKNNDVENYWFDFALHDESNPISAKDAVRLDECLRMRVFYSDIEKVTLVADYAASVEKVKALRHLESFDERM